MVDNHIILTDPTIIGYTDYFCINPLIRSNNIVILYKCRKNSEPHYEFV